MYGTSTSIVSNYPRKKSSREWCLSVIYEKKSYSNGLRSQVPLSMEDHTEQLKVFQWLRAMPIAAFDALLILPQLQGVSNTV